MADYNTSWDNETARPAKFNVVSLFRETAVGNLPASGFETGAEFLVEDDGIYVNTGNKTTCTWTRKLKQGADVSEDSQFAPLKKSDGTNYAVTDTEYTSPTSCSASSQGYSVTPTVSDDLTSYTDQASADAALPTTDTAKVRVNITTDKIEGTAVTDGTNDSESKDLTSVSDTAWVLEFDFEYISDVKNGTGYDQGVVVGISSADHNTSEESAQDGICFGAWHDNIARKYYVGYADAQRFGALPGSVTRCTLVASETGDAGDIFTIRLTRINSTSAKVELISKTTGLIVDSANLTIPSTVTGLRYFKVSNYHNTQNQSGNLVYKITNINFYNNTNSVVYDTANLKDSKANPTTNIFKTKSQINPWVKADMNTAQELLGVAIHFHADCDITSFKIETDENDDSNYRIRKTVPYNLITEGTWNLILFPRPIIQARRLKITGLDAGAKTLAINELAVFIMTESVINRRHRHILNFDPTVNCTTLTGA